MKMKKHYVGLDVHKDTVAIAVAEEGRLGEVRIYGQVSSDLRAVEKALRKIGADGGGLHVAYEAGPTGFVLQRRLAQLGIDCMVVAPSKTPGEKGKRLKTDRRDAEMLARLHRAGELTPVYVPDPASYGRPHMGSGRVMLYLSRSISPRELISAKFTQRPSNLINFLGLAC